MKKGKRNLFKVKSVAVILVAALLAMSLSGCFSLSRGRHAETRKTYEREETSEKTTKAPKDSAEKTEEETEELTEEPTEAPTEKEVERATEAPTEKATEAPTEESTEAPTEEPAEAPTEAPTKAAGVNPELVAYLKAYEDFIDSYIDFMKHYDASDFSMLMRYLELLSEYAEQMEKVNSIDQSEFTTEDLMYYNETMLRITQKIANSGL